MKLKADFTFAQILESANTSFPDPLTARLDAEILASYALGKNRTWLRTFSDNHPSYQDREAIEAVFGRRIQGEPVAHILGEWEFYSLKFKVTPDTLIPRPETELLVDRVLDRLKGNTSARVLDLGTGSGAIAVAIKHQRSDIEMIAVEFSKAAIEVAKFNAIQNRCDVHFVLGSWFQNLDPQHRFDAIVSNPPYVAQDDPHLQQGDLRFEPIGALTAGIDEFSDIKAIVAGAIGFLKPGGHLFVEHGYNQSEAVRAIFLAAGFKQIKNHRDYSNQPRVTEGVLL